MYRNQRQNYCQIKFQDIMHFIQFYCIEFQCRYFNYMYIYLHTYLFFLFFFYRRTLVTSLKMQNDTGEFVDLYVPRKCSSSSRIISAKDHASIQLEVVEVDQATGRMTGKTTKYAICGKLRYMGESDDCILRLAQRDGIIPKNL